MVIFPTIYVCEVIKNYFCANPPNYNSYIYDHAYLFSERKGLFGVLSMQIAH